MFWSEEKKGSRPEQKLRDRKWGRGPASPQLNKPNAQLDPLEMLKVAAVR